MWLINTLLFLKIIIACGFKDSKMAACGVKVGNIELKTALD